MFGNQNIHFWEGLFSKCFFTSCSCFWIFGILFFFFFFFAAILDFTDVKNVTEGRRREGDQALFFMWIDFFSSLFCPVLQQSAVVRFQ